MNPKHVTGNKNFRRVGKRGAFKLITVKANCPKQCSIPCKDLWERKSVNRDETENQSMSLYAWVCRSVSAWVFPCLFVCVRAVAQIKTKCRAFDENVTHFAQPSSDAHKC